MGRRSVKVGRLLRSKRAPELVEMRVRITVTPDLAERIKATAKRCPKRGSNEPEGRVVSYLLWYVEQVMAHYGEPLEYGSMLQRLALGAPPPRPPQDDPLDDDPNFSASTPHAEKIQ